MKPLLCYVLPEYRAENTTHFAYIPEFLKRLSDDYRVYLIVERGEIPPGISYEGTHRLSSHTRLFRFFETFLLMRRLHFLGYKNFYVHYSFLAAWCASLAGGVVWYWNCGEPWKYTRSFLRERFERHVYRRIDFLVTGTERLGAQYAVHYGFSKEKIRVFPNWIDPVKFKGKREKVEGDELRTHLKIIHGEKIVLFAHRLSRRKGAHYIPEIAKAFRDENVVLLVAGDGPERKNIELLISNYQLQNKVRFLGAVPNSQLPNYYFLADVFIMPSEEEGFPHVILEAMTTGTPFVAFDVGGTKEIIPPSLVFSIVPSGDISAFVAQVKVALTLFREERERIRRETTEWVEEHYTLHNAYANFPLHVVLHAENNISSLPREGMMADITQILFGMIARRFDIVRSTRLFNIAWVGLIGLTIQMTFFELFGLKWKIFRPATAALLGAELAIASNFIIHNMRTFRDRRIPLGRGIILKFLQFNLAVCVSLLIQWSTVRVGEHVSGSNLMLLRGFNLLGVGLGFIANYMSYTKLIWKRRLRNESKEA